MINIKGESTRSIFSSLEGHAMILLSGNNLMVKEAKKNIFIIMKVFILLLIF